MKKMQQYYSTVAYRTVAYSTVVLSFIQHEINIMSNEINSMSKF